MQYIVSPEDLPCRLMAQVDAAEIGAVRSVMCARPASLQADLAPLDAAQIAFALQSGFTGARGDLVLLPGPDGVSQALLGLGADRSHLAFGDLAMRLPQGAWRLLPGDYDHDHAVLGYCLGAYRFTEFRAAKRQPAMLLLDRPAPAALSQAANIWTARSLVNMPANLLGPAELADACEQLAHTHGASFTRVTGEALQSAYPTVHAVGAGSDRPPVVASLIWAGRNAGPDAPHISLCGKGVIFDTGGYDLKSASSMLRMKKDMGGAASMLALAGMLMDADLPIRLSLRLGCVENAVSGHAMRPLDVLRTRRGLTVEVGNTDAEGRLVLCDLLAEASDETPAMLICAATLTGAARVALGPDLPALFCNSQNLADTLLAAGRAQTDPIWQLPLWEGYDPWLDSEVADLNNVSGKSHAGAVVAALFMQRFVAPGVAWAHLDTYAWNETTRPARPEGGDAPGMRAMMAAIMSSVADRITFSGRN